MPHVMLSKGKSGPDDAGGSPGEKGEQQAFPTGLHLSSLQG